MLNSTEYEALVPTSFATLIRTTPSAYGLIATGSVAVVTNILVIALIWHSEALRKPSHFLISQLALADWLVGFSYVVTAIKRLIRLARNIPEVNTQFICCLEMFPLYFR